MKKRNPKVWRLHSDQDRSAITRQLATCPGSSRIILGRHENRASFGIDEETGTGIVTEEEAIAGRPVQYLLPTAAQHRDIERLNLHLLQHLR